MAGHEGVGGTPAWGHVTLGQADPLTLWAGPCPSPSLRLSVANRHRRTLSRLASSSPRLLSSLPPSIISLHPSLVAIAVAIAIAIAVARDGEQGHLMEQH
ncbi:hypothetical protein NL676_014144 [Syzygium grande]|nr:hypothetical protein NL676_014144 [Syzygium grande]